MLCRPCALIPRPPPSSPQPAPTRPFGSTGGRPSRRRSPRAPTPTPLRRGAPIRVSWIADFRQNTRLCFQVHSQKYPPGRGMKLVLKKRRRKFWSFAAVRIPQVCPKGRGGIPCGQNLTHGRRGVHPWPKRSSRSGSTASGGTPSSPARPSLASGSSVRPRAPQPHRPDERVYCTGFSAPLTMHRRMLRCYVFLAGQEPRRGAATHLPNAECSHRPFYYKHPFKLWGKEVANPATA